MITKNPRIFSGYGPPVAEGSTLTTCQLTTDLLNLTANGCLPLGFTLQ